MIEPLVRSTAAGGMQERIVGLPPPRAPLPGICMISDDFLPAATGVGIHVQIVSRELARRGHNVVAIASRRRGQPEFEVWNGVKVYRAFTVKVCGFYQALPSRRFIRRVFLKHDIGIVHYHYLGTLLKRARDVSAELGLANVHTYHMSPDLLTGPLFMRPFRGIVRRQVAEHCNSCDMVLAPSRNLADRLVRDGLRAPVRYLSNPVEIAAAPQPCTPRRSGRLFTVLYAGRLAPEKNLPLLLRGFALLAQERRDVQLLIAGEGGERGALEKLSRESGIADQARFLGFLDRARLAGCYASADVFVLPSLEECQPVVAIEAMSLGLPVLMSDRIVSARELVDEGASGFLVDAERPEDLAGRLRELAADPELRARLGAAGRRRSEEFGPGTIVGDLEACYRSLPAARGVRGTKPVGAAPARTEAPEESVPFLLKALKLYQSFMGLTGIELGRLDTADRQVLEDVILPAIAGRPDVRRVLFVGCARYTRHYEGIFAGKEYWTLEISPERSRWGARRHVVGSATELERHFAPGSLDAIVVNRVIGWGLNGRADIQRALAGCHRVLRDGGLLLLGWDGALLTHIDMRALLSSRRFFEPCVFGPLGTAEHVVAGKLRHTYTFLGNRAAHPKVAPELPALQAAGRSSR